MITIDRCSPTAIGYTTIVIGGPFSTPGSSPCRSVTKLTPMGGVCTSSVARVPARSTIARRCAGTTHTSWPVAAGHGCVGCSEPDFWDSMTPFYGRLPNVSGFGVETTANHIGETVVIGTAALFAAHGVGKLVQHQIAQRRATARAEAASAAAGTVGTAAGSTVSSTTGRSRRFRAGRR